jgi:DNA helicase-2/ATP-dependent DNA helicase PcrA
MTTVDLSSLNESQRRAVTCTDAAVLVLAGPGSGKTRVLTTRVADILSASPEESFRVLGLTFTHKAAEEMRERVKQLVPGASRRATLTTFHAFAADVLRQHGRHVGLKPDFRIVTQDSERKVFAGEAVTLLQDEGESIPPNLDPLPAIDTIMKQGLLPAEAAGAFPDAPTAERMQRIFTSYLQGLVAQNATDFGGLLVLLRMLLETRPAVARQLQIAYPHICVDEFQDTNVAQYRILKLIAPPGAIHLFVVADDDQIIYVWNGASTDRLRALRQDYGVTVIQLPENYRCPHDVVRMADALIGHNADRSADKGSAAAVKEAGTPSVRLERFGDADEEAAWIADDLAARPERSKCIVLARSKGLLDRVVEALGARDIVGVIAMRKEAFASAAIVWLEAALRLLCKPSANEHVARLNDSFYHLEGVQLSVLPTHGADNLAEWLAEALTSGRLDTATESFIRDLGPVVTKRDFLGLIERAVNWFDVIRERSEGTTPEAWQHFDDEKGIVDAHVRDICDRFEPDDLTLATFLQEFDLMPKVGAVPPDAVRCSTIHLAKGLEYPHVYLLGLVEGTLPDFRAVKKGDTHPDLEEERRNCFVAVTRCEESLTLTFSDNYFGYQKQPSRFLAEMGLAVPARQKTHS